MPIQAGKHMPPDKHGQTTPSPGWDGGLPPAPRLWMDSETPAPEGRPFPTAPHPELRQGSLGARGCGPPVLDALCQRSATLHHTDTLPLALVYGRPAGGSCSAIRSRRVCASGVQKAPVHGAQGVALKSPPAGLGTPAGKTRPSALSFHS